MSPAPAMPPALRSRFPPDGAAGAPLLAAAADLASDDRFRERWVIVSATTVQVYDLGGPAAVPAQEVPLADVRSAAVDPLVGGGALLVTTAAGTEELARFTTARQREFARIARYLQSTAEHQARRRKGEDSTAPDVPVDQEPPHRCPRCNLLLPEATRVCPACINKGKVLLRIVSYLRPHWRETLVIWALMLTGMGLSLVPPYLTRPLVDRVLAPVGDAAPAPERIRVLGLLVLALLGAQLLGQGVSIVRGRLLVRLGTQLSHRLRVQLFSHLQFLSLRFFDKKPVGALIARVTQDTESLEAVLVEGTQYFVVNILLLVGIGAVLFSMNWRLALLVLLPVPLVAWLSQHFWTRVRRLWQRFWHYRSRLTATVNDTLAGTRVVKAFAKEPQEVHRFTGHSGAVLASATAAEQTWTTLFPILWFLGGTGTLLVWYFGGREVIGGKTTMGTLLTFIAYLGAFYHPLQFLTRLADYLARSLTAAERVFEILDTPPEVSTAATAHALPEIRGRVEFRGVHFGYEPHKPALKNVSLDVSPGEMIGLVGHSGAGKSTTVNLICRFYDVTEGSLLIDGVDIRQVRVEDLRSQIGIVLQDTFLFNGTILENIRYARPEASLEEVMAAAQVANAHDFIVRKPDGYDTIVGERGQSLSSGERQRVAIARAVLHNPRILILDEATASVDTETEKQIQEAIARLVKGRTTFAIAHRLSTLRNADRLVVLKNGEIAECGTHAELLAKEGEFFRLVEMQKTTSAIMAVTR